MLKTKTGADTEESEAKDKANAAAGMPVSINYAKVRSITLS